MLHYTPEQASTFTIPLFKLALNGYMKASGAKPPEEKYVSRNELLDLMGKHG